MTTSRGKAAPAFTPEDADALIAGERGASVAHPDLAAALGALRSERPSAPGEARVSQMAAVLAAEALTAAPATAHRVHPLSPTARSARMNARTRLVSAVGGGFALVLGTAGMAAATAEEALPGDPLYTLKLTLEDVGVYSGGLDERVDEALELSDRGDDDEALDLLADALEDEGDDDAAEELRHAAEAVLSGGSEASLEVRTRVAAMLQWMAETDATGSEFGHGVAERARALHDSTDDDGTEGDGTEEGATDPTIEPSPSGGPDADAVAPSGGGKPEDAGKPDHAGKPEGAGKSSGGGKPDGAGSSGSHGRP